MKKFLSILLAFIIAFSAVSMVSFAEEPENTDTPTDSTDAPTDIADSMTAKWFRDNNFNNIYKMELAAKATATNEGISSTSTMYMKNGKLAIEVPFKFGWFTVKSKMITDFNTGNISIYSPSLPFFYISLDAQGNYTEELSQIPIFEDQDLVFESAYNQSEYYVEKMRNTVYNTYSIYYFKDGELVRIEAIDSDANTSIMDILSLDVSDKDVELPFYAFIDLSPLITFIETLVELI